MTRARALPTLLAVLLALPPQGARPQPVPARATPDGAELIDLAGGQWARDGRAPGSAPGREGGDGEGSLPQAVVLPMPERNLRWSLRFETQAAATHRLALQWVGAPDGLLYEIVIDGETLAPARDAWRPTPRALTADLGARWLGAGSHLLEFVAREQSVTASLRLVSLRLDAP